MNILLLGSGGREHAIAWKIAQSPKVDQLFIAPGNAGTALVGTNVNIKADDFSAIKEFALANHIGMVVVGPEDPLQERCRPGRYSRDRTFERGSATGRQQGLCEGLHDAPQHSDSPL